MFQFTVTQPNKFNTKVPHLSPVSQNWGLTTCWSVSGDVDGAEGMNSNRLCCPIRLRLQPPLRRRSPVCSYLTARCPSALRSTGRVSAREKRSTSMPSLRTPAHGSSCRRPPSSPKPHTSQTDASRWSTDTSVTSCPLMVQTGSNRLFMLFRSCIRSCWRSEETTSSPGCATCGRGRPSESPNSSPRCSAVTSSRWTTPSGWVWWHQHSSVRNNTGRLGPALALVWLRSWFWSLRSRWECFRHFLMRWCNLNQVRH